MHWKHLKHLDDDLKAIVVLWNLYRWKRVSWAFNEALEKQDVEEIVRRCSMPRPIFKMLDHDDYSTKSLKFRWFPRYTRDDIRRECCGWYGVTRGEEYLTAIEYGTDLTYFFGFGEDIAIFVKSKDLHAITLTV